MRRTNLYSTRLGKARIYALNRAMRAWRKWSLDTDRHALELLPPVDYLRMSYYERWLDRLAAQVVQYGLVTKEEMESGKAAPGSTKATPAFSLATSSRWLTRGIASSQDPNVRPLFKVRQRVRARNINPTGHTRLPRYARGKTGVIVARSRRLSSFPTPTPIFRARNASTSTPYVSPHGSCGGKTRRRATRFTSTCGMTTLSEPSPTSSSERLSDLPRLPRDEGGPVFAEPWQAQAFALAVKLSEQGHFTWKEWAAALADELQAAAKRGEPDDGSRYYEHWLAALERLVTAKGLADPTALLRRKEAWAEAYRNTPHGKPVELPQAPGKPDGRWLLLGLASAFAGYWMIQHAWWLPLESWGAWAIREGFDARSVIPQVGFVASAGLGSLLGMRHALEPDHLVAVSTLMSGERTSAKAAWLGACWGLGHTLTLLTAGAILVVLRAEMPAFAAEAFEFCVVLMLVGFGARAIYQGACRGSTGRTHSHAKPGTSRTPFTSAGGRSHDHSWWARYTDWREAARSPRSWWPRSRRR